MKRIITVLFLLLAVLTSGCSLFVPMEKPLDQGCSLLLWLPGASSVQVIADWNDWGGLVSAGGIINPLAGAMNREDSGIWSLDISGLPAGVYRYSFYVNGYKWIKDPLNPETATFEGRTVSVVMVQD
jgi:1,4-alpha-glucan branching enzyme